MSNKKTEEELIKTIKDLCQDINWDSMAFLDYKTGKIPAILIGEKRFLDGLTGEIEKFEEVLRSLENVEKLPTEEKKDDSDGGSTFH